MKRILLLISFVTISLFSSAQKYQDALLYGENKNRLDVFYLLGIPNDTFAIPSFPQDKRRKPHFAAKGNTLYLWDTTAYRWNIYAPGSGSADSTIFATLYRLDTAKTNIRASIGEKVPLTRKLTINGVAYDLSADRSWTVSGGSTDSSTFLIDTTYNRIASVYGTDTLVVKSLRMQYNGSTVTPTVTDSTISWNITGVMGNDSAYVNAYLTADSTALIMVRDNNGQDTFHFRVDTMGWNIPKYRFGLFGEDTRRTSNSYISLADNSFIIDSVNNFTLKSKSPDSLVFKDGELLINYTDQGNYSLQTKGRWYNNDGNGYYGAIGIGGVTGWIADFLGTTVGIFGPDTSYLSGYLKLKEKSLSPITSTGNGYIYPKTDGKLYFKNSSGTEYDLTSTSGGTVYVDSTSSNAAGDSLIVFKNGVRKAYKYPSSGGVPAGSDRQIQFNNAGAFGSSANFIYNSSGELIVGGSTDNGSYVLQVNGGNAYFSSNIYTAGTILEMGNGSRVNFGGSGSNPSFLANSTAIFAAKRDNSDYVDLTAKNLIAIGTLTTGNPGSGAGAWKLGTAVSSSGLVMNSTQYVEVSIGGTVYRLAVVDPPYPTPKP